MRVSGQKPRQKFNDLPFTEIDKLRDAGFSIESISNQLKVTRGLVEKYLRNKKKSSNV